MCVFACVSVFIHCIYIASVHAVMHECVCVCVHACIHECACVVYTLIQGYNIPARYASDKTELFLLQSITMSLRGSQIFVLQPSYNSG